MKEITKRGQPTDVAVSEKRRRLLKSAAVSAPLIATLQSGAARAAASAHFCVTTAQTDPPVPSTTKSDAWVRVQVKRYRFQPPGAGTTPLWLYDMDNIGGGSGIYYQETDTNADGSGDPVEVDTSAGWHLLTSEDRWVVVLFDTVPDGAKKLGEHPKLFFDITSAVPSRTPLTASCLCSIDPTQCTTP